jgi:hypothetical protein
LLDGAAGFLIAKHIRGHWAQLVLAIAAGATSAIMANLVVYWTSPGVFTPGEIGSRIVVGFFWHPLLTLLALWYFRRQLTGARVEAPRLTQKVSPERGRRLGGWARIGVVLSVAWVIGALAYATHDYLSALEVARQPVFTEPNSAEKEWVSVGLETPLSSCYGESHQAVCRPKMRPVLALAFGPLIGVWLTVLAAIAAVRWVRAGFRSTS